MTQLKFSTIACFILLQSLSSISSSFAGGPGDQKPVHEQPKIAGSEDEGPVDERPGVIRELQQAIRVDDKRWMADHLHQKQSLVPEAL